MNKAFFINGGAGRVLCSIPALERYAETHDDFVIVSESWSELYLNSKVLREKVFPLGHKDLFENYLTGNFYFLRSLPLSIFKSLSDCSGESTVLFS